MAQQNLSPDLFEKQSHSTWSEIEGRAVNVRRLTADIVAALFRRGIKESEIEACVTALPDAAEFSRLLARFQFQTRE